MGPRPSSRALLVTAFLVAWGGFTLWRYQRLGEPPGLFPLLLAVAWLAGFTASCWGAGGWLLRLFRLGQLANLPKHLVQVALGAVVLAAGAAFLGALGLLSPGSLGAFFAAGLLACWWERKGSWHFSSRWRGGLLLGLGLLPLVFTLAAVPSLSPFYDQLNYHLGMPFQWLQQGNLALFPRHAYTFLPASASLLYLYPLALVGAWGGQAVHWWAGALAVLATGALAYALAGPRAGLLASALLATSPTVLESSTWAAADLVTTAFAVVSWLPPVLLRQRLSSLGWLSCGLLAGMSCSSKILGVATVLLPFAFAFFLFPSQGKDRLRAFGAFTGGCLLALGPWLGRNLLTTGDPLYPFGAWLWQKISGHRVKGAELASQVMGATSQPLDPWSLASLSTFHPQGDGGEVGPMFFALLPLAAWAALKKRRARVFLAAALAGVLGWAFGPLRGRYLLPVLPLLAITSGWGWAHLRHQVSRPVLRLFSLFLAFALGWSWARGLSPLWFQQVATTFGFASQEEVLRKYFSCWPGLKLVNEALPGTAKVLLVGESRLYGWQREILVEDPFHQPFLLELAATTSSPAGLAWKLKSLGVTHVLVNWAEAQRMATMNRRQDYFGEDPVLRQRITTFFANYTTLLAQEPPVSLYQLHLPGGMP